MRVLLGTKLDEGDEGRIRDLFPHVELVKASGGEEMLRAVPGCEVAFTAGISRETLEAASELRWIQARSAGIEEYPLALLAQRGIRLTTASGAHGTPIAENILAMMLAFAIRLPVLVRGQIAHEWVAGAVYHSKFELEGQTLLVVGLGGLGSALARKASALGMHVLGMRRSGRNVDGVAELLHPDQLMQSLPRADHVALCLPLTADTTAFLDEPQLRAMKPSAYVYNAGRGQSIRRDALLRALREGWIAGAGLDVTDPEPLPPDDPLWDFPNVLLSQHTSGHSPRNSRRVTEILLENLRRYESGEPLINEVDAARGY